MYITIINNISFPNEVWKDVVGFEGLYKVSNLGRVFSMDKSFTFPNGGFCKRGLSIKKPYIDRDGYLRISLTDKNHKPKTFAVHFLVAQAFLEQVDEKKCIDHINGIRNDNNADNLRWCTNKENCNFPLAKENKKKASRLTRVLKKDVYDKARRMSFKPVYVYTINGKYIEKCDSYSLASRKYGADQPYLSNCIKKVGYAYGNGHVFSKKRLNPSFFPYKPKTLSRKVFIIHSDIIVDEVKSINQAAKKYNVEKWAIKKGQFESNGIIYKTKILDVL